jgi:hypothetical protein
MRWEQMHVWAVLTIQDVLQDMCGEHMCEDHKTMLIASPRWICTLSCKCAGCMQQHQSHTCYRPQTCGPLYD